MTQEQRDELKKIVLPDNIKEQLKTAKKKADELERYIADISVKTMEEAERHFSITDVDFNIMRIMVVLGDIQDAAIKLATDIEDALKR